ncbi:hypothetical protein CUN25_00165 [Enterococcus faecium]|nr:hypothetical protein CUN25_00165 [Enterococcus faecium]
MLLYFNSRSIIKSDFHLNNLLCICLIDCDFVIEPCESNSNFFCFLLLSAGNFLYPVFKKKNCESSQFFFRINGALRPTPRSQVTIVIKHEKLFFEITPCDSELNGRLTTS